MNNYTIKEVIFGLREFYLQNRRELQKLKRMCMVDYTKAEDYRFYMCDDRLFCEYYQQQNLIKRLLEIPPEIISQAVCARDKNQEYRFLEIDDDYPIKFIESKKEILLEKANEINNSSFVKAVSNLRINSGVDYNKNYILMDPLSISINIKNDDNQIVTNIQYISMQDIIKVTSFDKKISPLNIIDMFYTIPFSKDNFSDEIREIIDSSNILTKPIDMNNSFSTKDITFNIFEDTDQFVLEKTRRVW